MLSPPSSAGADVRAEIERICESQRFRKAAVLRDLLRYLAEHASENLNEYAIGVEVLGRRPDFDPRTDASVRVHMGRLRQRLKDYYENEGSNSDARVILPAASYQPILEKCAVEEAVTPPRNRRRLGAMAIAAMVLGLLVLLLGWDNWRLRQTAGLKNSAAPVMHPLWSQFVKPGQPVNLIVPAPMFFLWPNLVARDFFVNDPSGLGSSSSLRALREKLGEPEVSQIYTVASDTVAASSLSRYLSERGVPVTVRDTPTLPLELLGTSSTLLLIGPGSVGQVGDLLSGMNFYLKVGTRAVLNRNPRAGEAALWAEKKLAPLRTVSYGIIASIPGREAGSKVLLLASRHNTSLAGYLTTSSELDRLTAHQRGQGMPAYFEAVLEYEQNGDRSLRAKLLAFRAIHR